MEGTSEEGAGVGSADGEAEGTAVEGAGDGCKVVGGMEGTSEEGDGVG